MTTRSRMRRAAVLLSWVLGCGSEGAATVDGAQADSGCAWGRCAKPGPRCVASGIADGAWLTADFNGTPIADCRMVPPELREAGSTGRFRAGKAPVGEITCERLHIGYTTRYAHRPRRRARDARGPRSQVGPMKRESETAGERLGVGLGWAAAPVFALVSWARRARTFHPRGDAFLAEVAALPGGGPLGEVLAGPCLVRFSGALWKSRWEHLDVLGCALRFRRRDDASTEPDPGDQDLLFATILRPWTMGLAPFTTDASDYLSNLYYAVSPFDVPGFGRAFLRLRPEPRHGAEGPDRAARLDATVAREGVVLTLEVRQRWRWGWVPAATITLRGRADVQQEALAFSPFRDGRGVVPRGLVHALRRAVYPASQRARPRR